MAGEKAELFLHDGVVAGHPESDSIAISGTRIMRHGRFEDLKPLVGPRTHLIPLGGRTVAPGLIDCHLHFMEAAAVAASAPLRARNISELLAELRLAAGRTPPGNWLKAFGYDEALSQERRGPTRAELDQVVTKSPLRLRHQTLHASWLNSRAINALGLEAPDFVAPAGAILVRDATGALTGLVVGLEEWISARMPRVTEAELESRARFFSRALAATGVTAFTDATVRNGAHDITTFGRLASTGSIVQRVGVMIGSGWIEGTSALWREAESAGMRLAGVKFVGVDQWDTAKLVRTMADALAQELDCAFHCTEVEELEAALNAIAAARERVNTAALANTICRIEHGGLIPPGYPERIGELGAWVVTNPGFIYFRGVKYAAEPGLIPFLYRGKSLISSGISLAGGTDAPVTPAKPLVAIAAANSRTSLEGYGLAVEEKLDRSAAFQLFTSSAARLSRLDSGVIQPGRLADLMVLPSNPLTVSPAELVRLPVDLTIIGGQIVYERGRPAVSRAAGRGTSAA